MPNGKQYPIWIDSGMSTWPILVNDVVARENGLVVYQNGKSTGDGLCELASLQLNDQILKDLPCLYTSRHWEFRILGIPVWKDNRVLFGLETMSKFKYIMFDNVQKELELSSMQTFKPKANEDWSYYPFELKNFGYQYGRRLLVNFPIEGEIFQLEFDTGGRSMFINEDLWQEMKKELTVLNRKETNFASYQFGLLPCTSIRVKKMRIANNIVRAPNINVLPKDSPYLFDSSYGVIGIEYFRDTLVVLDFERMLVWVKNEKNAMILASN
jgi:hypothetical protein